MLCHAMKDSAVVEYTWSKKHGKEECEFFYTKLDKVRKELT